MKQSNEEASKDLIKFFRERMKNILKDKKIRADIIEASISSRINDNFLELYKKTIVMNKFISKDLGKDAVSTYKRASNILDQAENSPFLTNVNGFEVEWQTRSWWLPDPFDGFILNLNYSKIYSETTYPRSFVVNEQISTFPFIIVSVIDTFRTGPMPFQADDIANLSLGYEKKSLSARVSFVFQGRTLSNVGVRKEIDGFTDDLARIDLSLNYKLNPDLSLFINCNNATNQPDQSYRFESSFPTDIEYYGCLLYTSDAADE